MEEREDARQVVGRFGGMEGKEQLLVEVAGVEGAADLAEDLLEGGVGECAVERTLPPENAVAIECGQPVDFGIVGRVVQHAAAERVVHGLNQVGFLRQHGISGLLEKRIETDIRRHVAVSDCCDRSRLSLHPLQITPIT